ncbi:TetR/AcrR family transcriptional regulator [Streptomyces bottropensis]|uniref:TetR/AcrR family transcriptional regulator n=1 Tax=Streptomyces bottropensis TaxID=42235 RepID=UPI00382BFDA4
MGQGKRRHQESRKQRPGCGSAGSTPTIPVVSGIRWAPGVPFWPRPVRSSAPTVSTGPVVRIAEAAGVSHHLITYYFGDKRGLCEALSEQWLEESIRVSQTHTFAEATRRYVRWAHKDPAWVHTLTREEPGMPRHRGRAGHRVVQACRGAPRTSNTR